MTSSASCKPSSAGRCAAPTASRRPDFGKVVVCVEVTTVKMDSNQQPLHPTAHYSVISRVLGRQDGPVF